MPLPPLPGLGQYAVNDLYPTIQGEGVHTGVPMILLRLHGCAVGCPWCDTRETWDYLAAAYVPTLDAALGTSMHYTLASPAQIGEYIETRWPSAPLPEPRWVMVTGGEPAQQDLAALADELHDRDYRVLVETSGTAGGVLDACIDHLCLSPKLNMPGGKPVLPAVVEIADEIKWVVGKLADLDALDAFLARFPLRPRCTVSLQPLSCNRKATDLCVQTCLSRGFRLSVQTHKYLEQR
jgi:7-carboxy-7-deazaguanine synthase